MLINKPRENKFPERCKSEYRKITQQLKHLYLTASNEELHQIFMKEQLASKATKKPTHAMWQGEIVLVGIDKKKGVLWPLGRVIELFTSKGIVCIAKVKTKKISWNQDYLFNISVVWI